MANFSIGEAVGSGFGIIRRRPMTVVIWAVAYLVLYAGPYLLLMSSVLPDVIGVYQAAGAAALEHTQPDSSRMMELGQKMQGIQALIMLLSLVFHTVFVAAVYRAVLEPENSRFGYLRLGAQELWLGLTFVAFALFSILMSIVVMIPVGILSAVAGASMGKGPMAGLMIGLLVLVACVAILWVLLRLSMAFPMSFARRRFALFESWDMTRGQAFKLFLVALAVSLIVVLIEIVIVALVCGVVLGVSGGDLRTLVHEPPEQLLARLAPVLVVVSLAGSVIGMAIYAVMIAPWASIYKQLTADEVPV